VGLHVGASHVAVIAGASTGKCDKPTGANFQNNFIKSPPGDLSGGGGGGGGLSSVALPARGARELSVLAGCAGEGLPLLLLDSQRRPKEAETASFGVSAISKARSDETTRLDENLRGAWEIYKPTRERAGSPPSRCP
jgi:hypothetical protein